MGNLACAPVVLLGYHRPDFTRIVFEQIRRARPSILFLVMDGPRPDVAGDAEAVAQVRTVCSEVDWDCQVHRIFADTNLGLKTRVSSGLDEVFSIVDRAIILEDDCVPTADFFRFATELLARYQESPEVGLISGASRIRGGVSQARSYSFSRDVRIWGWATWARTWNKFRESGDLTRRWTPEDRSLLPLLFPTRSRRRHIRGSLEHAERLDSWALPFAVHCLRQGYRNPVPHVNLVRNVGFGETSTHTQFESFVKDVPTSPLSFPLRHPSDTSADDSFDRSEARADLRALWTYPLLHPVDTALRVLRYLSLQRRAGSKRHP